MELKGNGEPPKETLSFDVLGRHLGETQATLHEMAERQKELARDLAEKEKQLETYIEGNAFAKENDFKLLASEEDIGTLERDIQLLTALITQIEAIQARAVHLIDQIGAQEERMVNLMLNNPTTESNPDDKNL